MEVATTAFLVTLAIVGALAVPLVFFYILGLFGNALKALGQYLENKSEEIKKQPPFDEVEVNVNPATRIMAVRFMRRGKIIWQGSGSQRDINSPVEFKQEPTE